MAIVVGIVNGRGLGIDTRHGNQPNKKAAVLEQQDGPLQLQRWVW